MWIEFFIIGGMWWWLLTAALLVTLIWEISDDRGGAAIFTLGMYLAIIHLFGDASLSSIVSMNPEILYIGFPIYFVGGTIWAFIKWFLYIKRRAYEYKETRLEFLKDNNVVDVPNELKKKWKNWWGVRIPQAKNNKGKILTWMSLWPVSLTWTLIDDPWRYIYRFVADSLQKISDSVYRKAGYNDDVAYEEPKKEDESKNGSD
jgi:hypothetical protein